MLVCLMCWEIYENDALTREFGELLSCPKKSCDGQDVVDLDECWIPAIRELNEKGYSTRYCCSGHLWNFNPNSENNGRTYIYFDDLVERKDLTNLPPGFVMDADNGRGVTIRKEYNVSDPVELHIAILKTAIELTTWAQGLPELPEA